MSDAAPISRINISGEGEESGVVNQQAPHALSPTWRTCDGLWNLQELATQGHDLLICANDRLPFADESIDLVTTNNVRIDGQSHLGPYPQQSEIWRVLKSYGVWLRDGVEVPRP